MFKVICIKGDDSYDEQTLKSCPGPKLNEICTVTGSFVNSNGMYYFLAEYPPEESDDGFCSSSFRILTDELALVREKEEVCIQ